LSAFSLQSYCTQITDICTQIADDVHDKVRPRFECKSGTMKDGWRGNLGRSAAQAMIHPLAEHPDLAQGIPEAENQLALIHAVRDFGTNMPLNSAIWVQNLGIKKHFPRFECSVTSM
jgi:hypothetical protein